MRRHEFQARVLENIDILRANGRIEGTYAEVKLVWPTDPDGAARRLAGLCNAAQGEPVFWIIGVDEKNGTVFGAQNQDLDSWYREVVKCFRDGFAPRIIQDDNFQVESKPIAAILFESEAAPYVIRNPAFGKSGGGSVELEVPWREGTGTRSARREDLLRLLSPMQMLPEVEFQRASLRNYCRTTPGPATWTLEVVCYIAPRTSDRVVIPYHRCRASFLLGATIARDLLRVEARPEGNSPAISRTPSELLLNGPGLIRWCAYGPSADDKIERIAKSMDATFTLRLLPVGCEHGIAVGGQMRPKPSGDDSLYWSGGSDEPPTSAYDERGLVIL